VHNPGIRVVNHAADVEHFSKAGAADTIVPADIAALPYPRIGFVGMIDPVRFDPRLIVRLAENRVYQIVMVGGFLNGANRLIPDLPNIHRLGMRKVADLPGCIKGMDVCIMPYRLNETTQYIFPLKLFEYLASGKPVVATQIPAVEKHREFLYVASNEDEFVELVSKALRADSARDRLRRQEHARKHDWSAHVTRKAQELAVWFENRERMNRDSRCSS
jgi:glycosyltransferase involved in cell wall biosynthesis